MNELLIKLINEERKVISFKKGDIISFENDLCTKVRLVVSGHIRISSTTSNGQDIVYKDLFTNDLFGHNLIFSNNPRYRGDVICMENSEIIELSEEEFLSVLSNNIGILKGYLNYQSEDSKKLNQTLKIVSIPTSEEKLMYLLQLNHGEIKIKSITDLSAKLNISRETTSRIVHKLIKQNKISLINNVIKVK